MLFTRGNMMETNIKKTILFFLLILLLASFSYSLEDFNGYLNTSSIELCECSDYQDSISIENAGDEPGQYNILLQGGLKDNMALSRQAFSLLPGERININYAVYSTCGKTGNYDIIFDINSASGLAKRIVVPVSIKKCKNLELSTKKNTAEICPCSQVKYQLELKNPGSFSETYSLEVSKPFEKWSKLTAKEITLASGQNAVLDFYLKPSCDVYGNYSSLFKITSKKTKLTARMPLYLYIYPCYEFNLTLGDYIIENGNTSSFRKHEGEYELCEKEPKTIPILIENRAPIPNRFDFELKGENWINPDKERVIVNAKNSTVIELIAEPPYLLNENYTFSFSAETYWGKLEQEKEINISVGWCYTPFIKTKKIYVNYTKSTNELSIQNQGSKKAGYFFKIIEKPEWVSVSPFNLTLNPNENVSINIISEPSEEVRQGNYILIINATAGEQGLGYEHTILIKLDKKGVIGKSYDYLKQKIGLAYGKAKEFFLAYKWYLLEGVAGLIILLIIISVSRKQLTARRERISLAKEKAKEAEKAKAAKEDKKAAKKIKKEKPVEVKIRFSSLLKIILLLLAAAALGYIVFYFREYLIQFIWYIAAGLAVFVLLALAISLLRSGKARKHLKEKWVFYLLALIIIAVLFWLSYSIMPNLIKGNFSAITIYPGKFTEEGAAAIEQSNISQLEDEAQTGLSEEVPAEKIPLTERIYFYAKNTIEPLKQYSYYIGFGVLALIFLLILLRFFKRRGKKEVEEYVEIKKPKKEKKKKEIKKAEKTKKGKKDFNFILKGLLLILIIVILFFIISYLRNYLVFFAWYIAAGLTALILVILIILAVKNKKTKKHFKKRWKAYLLAAILILILAGAYLCYQNKYYQAPYEKTKEWALGLISGLYSLEEEEAVEKELIEAFESENKTDLSGQKSEEPIEPEGAVILWEQDSNYFLDLNEYFHDPDNDQLYFSSSQMENIKAEIDDYGVVSLNPRKGWYGLEKVVFSADDSRGGIIKSEEISLIVKKTDKQNLSLISGLFAKIKTFAKKYAYYIIAGFAILFISLFFFGEKKGSKRKPTGRKRKS